MVLSLYSLRQSCMILSLLPQNLVVSPLLFQNYVVLSMAAARRFKSQRPSSFATPFPTPPTISYTCQHPSILPALLGCHSKSRQVWPHGMEPIFSKFSRRHCNQGELLPSSILVKVTCIPLAQSGGHSYLTHP